MRWFILALALGGCGLTVKDLPPYVCMPAMSPLGQVLFCQPAPEAEIEPSEHERT